MRNIKITIVCILFFTLTGCQITSKYFINLNEKTFPATQASAIQLYFAPDKPDKPYEVIGSVVIMYGSWYNMNHPTAMADMKEKAAQKGADAILNITIGVDHGANLTGLAVKWK